MRTALPFILCSAVTFAAPAKPVVALLPPDAPDDDLAGFGMMLEARAAELIEQSDKFSELHIKQVLAMAEAEGLAANTLAEPANAQAARTFLGADRVVTVKLDADAKGMTLTGSIVDAKKTTPFTAKLPVTWPEALVQGSEAVAKAVLATEKATLPKKPSAQPESKSPEALRSLAQCYAIVIRQPLGIDNPAVLNGEELDAASAACEKALAQDPSLKFATAVLALSRAIIGDAAGATKALNGLSVTDDMVEPYTLARFWMVTRFQSNEDGLASLRDVLKRHPGELIARNYLADTQGVLNDHAGAQTTWTEYLAQVPASPFGHGRLSKALARQNKHDEAIAAAKKALELAPTSKVARLELGSRYIDANKLDDAIATLGALTDAKGEALLRLGWAHWLKGSVDAAAPLFQKALETATAPSEWRTRGRAHYNLALVEAKRGKADAAKAALKASMLTGYKVRAVDPLLEKIAKDVERAEMQKAAPPDAGAVAKLTLPRESSLVPFDPMGNADLTKKKDAPPQGFVIYKF
jgi:tetratricopeptide (TPR) repeat protein